MKKYSVLTFNIGGYELLHEIPQEAINPDIEYIYVTDDHNIKSDSWNVVYTDDLTGSTIDKCYQIRLFPFQYVNTDAVMCIDGSMSITHDLYPIFKAFDNGGYDAAVNIHPGRNTVVQEYQAWISLRDYPVEQAVKCSEFIANKLHYDIVNYKGLYQAGFKIQRNDVFNKAWNLTTYDVLKYLATEPDTVERVDQIISSVILNKMFSYKKIMPVSSMIMDGRYLNLNVHNTNIPQRVVNIIEPYLFNEKVEMFE